MWSLRLIAVLSCCLAVAGCGATAKDSADTPTAPGKDSVVEAEISVTYSDPDASLERTVEVVCPPPDDDELGMMGACITLTSNPDVLEPVGGDMACTEIYGGPQTATVRGTVDGDEVDASFSRTNGCEIARWDAAEPILGLAGTAVPPEKQTGNEHVPADDSGSPR